MKWSLEINIGDVYRKVINVDADTRQNALKKGDEWIRELIDDIYIREIEQHRESSASHSANSSSSQEENADGS